MKTKAQFIKDLKESDEHTQSVYMWALMQGYEAQKPWLQYDHADEWDILVTKRIEVKHLQVPFTTDHFPYAWVIIDEERKVRNRDLNTLEMYVILNKDRTCACIITPDTEHAWYWKVFYDKVYKEERMFLLCPKNLCEFINYP